MDTHEQCPLFILLVEDDLSHATLLHRAFQRSPRPCRITDARTLREAREYLLNSPVDLIIADYMLPDGKGLDLLPEDPMLQKHPLLLLTAFGDESLAVEAIKRGAMDYVVKTPEAMVALPQTVKRVMRDWQLRFEHREAIGGLNSVRSELEAMDRQLRAERARSNHLALQAHVADVAKGAFLAAISHEIRTPMNAVLGFTRLAMELPDLPTAAKRYLSTIESKGCDLLRLIDNALDMARLEAGRLELAPVAVDVPAMVSDLADSMKIKAAAKGLSLACSIAREIPRALTGHAEPVGQVLYNLLDNAIKFTDHGSVEISVLPVAGPDASDGRIMLEFEVRDTGPGIPEGRRSLLFELFTKVEFSEMRRYSGLGLGLTVSKRLIERIGGQIGLREGVTQGSAFFFTAPFARPVADKAVCLQATPGPLRILLVDDDPDCRLLVHDIMSLHGHSVQAEKDGAAALAAFEQDAFDVVFTDLLMPVMDGFALARAIREKEAGNGKHVPVLGLTACNVEDEWARCRAAGMDDCIAKPFTEDVLLEAIARFLPAESIETGGS